MTSQRLHEQPNIVKWTFTPAGLTALDHLAAWLAQRMDTSSPENLARSLADLYNPNLMLVPPSHLDTTVELPQVASHSDDLGSPGGVGE